MTEKIYCLLCQDWYDKSELKEWSGDDRRHFLCPGCDSDLLPSKPSLDKEIDLEREAEKRREEKEIAQLVADLATKMQNWICHVCNTPIKQEVQIGRCVYARPCGHRLWQGKARRTKKESTND